MSNHSIAHLASDETFGICGSIAQISWDDPPGVLNPDLQELVHSCLRPNFEERPSASEVSDWIAANKQRVTSSFLSSQDLDSGSLAPHS